MKNLIKHFKHLWKDPVNSIEEIEVRKKELKPVLLISLGIMIVPFALAAIIGKIIPAVGSILSPIFTGVAFVGLVGVAFSGFLFWIMDKAKKKFAALTCDKCNTLATIKTLEEYAEFVSYTIKSDAASYKGVSHPSSQNGVVSSVTAKGSSSAVVSIMLKCPNCGNVKELSYIISPFKCSIEEKKVAVRDLEIVKMRLENSVKTVVDDYNDIEKRANIPYSIHSKHNPKYDQRTKAQAGNDTVAYPRYNGVKIDYRKDVEEMVAAFFLENQLDGQIVDPNKPKKSK